MTIVTPSILSMPHASGCKNRPNRNAHSVFSLKPTAAVPCGTAVQGNLSSDDDEHNTDRNFLLLFADIVNTPTLLEGWIFSRFRSNFPLHLIASHFLTTLSSPHSEHVCYTRLKTDSLASLLGPRSWKGTHTLSPSLCGWNSWLHSVNSRHVDSHRSCTARFE